MLNGVRIDSSKAQSAAAPDTPGARSWAGFTRVNVLEAIVGWTRRRRDSRCASLFPLFFADLDGLIWFVDPFWICHQETFFAGCVHESSQQVMDSDPRSFAEGLQANFEIRKLLVALLPSMQTDIFSAVSSMSPLGLNVLTNPESAYSAINLTIESRCNPKLR